MAPYDIKIAHAHNTAIDTTELHEVSDPAVEQKLGTQHDQSDMVRMGKHQELRVSRP